MKTGEVLFPGRAGVVGGEGKLERVLDRFVDNGFLPPFERHLFGSGVGGWELGVRYQWTLGVGGQVLRYRQFRG